MKRILIAYYSLGGKTVGVAMDLAARLGADIMQIREVLPRRGFLGYVRAAVDSLREKSSLLDDLGKCAGDYDLILIGTPVWAGKMTPAIRTYLKTIRGEVRRVAFFSTSGATDIARLVPAMEQLVGLEAIASLGLTEHELQDPALCAHKLADFVRALRNAASVRGLDTRRFEHRRLAGAGSANS